MNSGEPKINHEERLDEALADYMRRVDIDGMVDRDAFLAEYPDVAEQLLQLLDTASRVDNMAGPPTGAGNPSDAASGQFDDTVGRPLDLSGVDATIGESGAPRLDLTLDEGSRFGDYELLEPIGRGGMGVVYKARQLKLDRIVAVKMILTGRLASEQDVQRFYTEARAAGRIDHPNIITIYEVDESDGHHFFSMDYVEGTDLAKLTADTPLEPKQAARYLREMAVAVQAAHNQNILHRDLKPANILIDDDGRVFITDFGLAKELGNQQGLTSTGATMGTPSYMSPEQAGSRHGRLGPETDIYSLGAILYVMLTGQPPFRGPNVAQTVLDVMHKQPLEPHHLNPQADPDLETICLKCLAKDPKHRYRTAEELTEELDRFLNGKPILARPATRLKKFVNWCHDIPIVAALAGHRVVQASPMHRKVQRAMVMLTFMVPAIVFSLYAVRQQLRARLPARVVIATGAEQGMYSEVGQQLSQALGTTWERPVEVLVTQGSQENRELLLNKKAHLALMQANSFRADELAVVAPLYYEVVHVLVRKESPATNIEQLAGHSIALGRPQSGMRRTALLLLEHMDVDTKKLKITDHDFRELGKSPEVDAAIVTTGLDNPALHRLLATENYRILPIPEPEDLTLRTPTLRPFRIRRKDCPDLTVIPEDGVQTVATAAFLVCCRSAPRKLVEGTLQTWYNQDLNLHSQISRHVAAQWPSLSFHAVAREFFTEDEPTQE